jgi:hypothetical protein
LEYISTSSSYSMSTVLAHSLTYLRTHSHTHIHIHIHIIYSLSTVEKKSSLMFSAEHDQLEATMLLLERGAMGSINLTDRRGWTALHYAAVGATPALAQVLLSTSTFSTSCCTSDLQANYELFPRRCFMHDTACSLHCNAILMIGF